MYNNYVDLTCTCTKIVYTNIHCNNTVHVHVLCIITVYADIFE